MELNNTPIRTSKNFGINNIDLKYFEFPKKIDEFNNVSISGDAYDFNIEHTNKKELQYNKNDLDKKSLTCEISKNNNSLTYGIGKAFENQVFNDFNNKVNIEVCSFDEKDLFIEYRFNEENTCLVDNIEIIAKPNSRGTIYIKYISENNKINEYHNGIINLHALENSSVNIVVVNLLSDNANNFLSIENKIEESATVKYNMVDFGGKTAISNYYSDIQGGMSKNDLNTIYLGTKEQVFDINYIVEVKGELADANIEVQGALQDNAIKNFKGTIDFKKGCKKAKGNENEFCMLLSNTAKSKALPMLLCTEEDVEGNHSTATGKVDEDILFYIMSRGISEKEAMKLIVKAKFNNILDNIKDEETKQLIIDEIDKKIL